MLVLMNTAQIDFEPKTKTMPILVINTCFKIHCQAIEDFIDYLISERFTSGFLQFIGSLSLHFSYR
jgi:hypothetical protein